MGLGGFESQKVKNGSAAGAPLSSLAVESSIPIPFQAAMIEKRRVPLFGAEQMASEPGQSTAVGLVPASVLALKIQATQP